MSKQGNVTQVYAVPGLPVILPQDLNRHLTLGALVVSSWASVFSGGIVLACGYVYYTAFPRDQFAIKILVAACLVLSSLDMIVETIWAYDSLVDHWGTIPGSVVLSKLFYLNTVCCGGAVTLVQSAYAWRVWRLSKNLVLPGVIVLLSVVQLVFVLYVVGTWGAEVFVSDMNKVLPVAYGRGVAGLAADTLITGSIVYYLRGDDRANAAQDDDDRKPVIRRITCKISRIVQANSLSLISQLMTIVLYAVKDGMYFLLNDLLQAKIYCFSLLILLNARRSSTTLFVEKSGSMSQASGNNMSLSNMGVPSSATRRTAPGTFAPTTLPAVVRVTQPLDSQEDYVWDGRGKTYVSS